MAVTTKVVNIKAPIPVKTVTPPVYGVKLGVTMTLGDILKCLCRRAVIDQVLSDGSTVRLTDKNFREDFEAQLKARQRKEAEEAKKIASITTGSIDDINMIDDIDEDDDDDSDEPEEAGNVVIETVHEDGSVVTSIGVESSYKEDEDVEHNEEPDETTEDTDNDDSEELEEESEDETEDEDDEEETVSESQPVQHSNNNGNHNKKKKKKKR